VFGGSLLCMCPHGTAARWARCLPNAHAHARWYAGVPSCDRAPRGAARRMGSLRSRAERAGTYSFPSHARLSDEAKDLISRMLCVDVDKRITMVEIQARLARAVQCCARMMLRPTRSRREAAQRACAAACRLPQAPGALPCSRAARANGACPAQAHPWFRKDQPIVDLDKVNEVRRRPAAPPHMVG
jgi:hypothetical protein